MPHTGAGGAGDMLATGALRTGLETRRGTALVSRLLLLAVAALFVSLRFGAYARRGGGESASGNGDGGGEQARHDRRDLVFGLSAGG
ncbi:hypothetical protein ACLIYN_27745, partial [Streptomyces atacamensis]